MLIAFARLVKVGLVPGLTLRESTKDEFTRDDPAAVMSVITRKHQTDSRAWGWGGRAGLLTRN